MYENDLRDECRLRVFENRILRRIFGPKRMGSREGPTMSNFIVKFKKLNLWLPAPKGAIPVN